MLLGTISMLRVAKARESQRFYCDKLGFEVSWEHDPGDSEPVFLEVRRDDVALHLSEHEGDGPPGVQVYDNVSDARALYDEFTGKGVEIAEAPAEAPWGELVFEVRDPDGDILRIGSPLK